MTWRLSAWRVSICGLILAGMPLVAIARHLHVHDSNLRIQVPLEISQTLGSNQIVLQTPLHAIDIDQITGVDEVTPGDTVYVHMARGPDRIAYPFALTRTPPDQNKSDHFFALRGWVRGINNSQITLGYRFDTASLSTELDQALSAQPDAQLSAEIAIKDKGTSLLTAIYVGEERIAQRVIENPELKALTQRGAKIIPAKNPPR